MRCCVHVLFCDVLRHVLPSQCVFACFGLWFPHCCLMRILALSSFPRTWGKFQLPLLQIITTGRGPVQTVQAGALSGPMGMCVDAQDRQLLSLCTWYWPRTDMENARKHTQTPSAFSVAPSCLEASSSVTVAATGSRSSAVAASFCSPA